MPNGIATGLDIGFSNYSLVFISLSFYVMCKSTTPIFLLCFSFAWGIERPSWSLAGIVAVIVGGLLLLVAGETQFDLVGFLLVMTAAMLAGLRWTITQVLLQGGTLGDNNNNSSGHGHGGGGRSPVEAIYQLTPIMGISLLILSLGHEKLWDTIPTSPYFETLGHALVTGVIMLVGGLIAFLMVWSEFALIANTSALTFMVAGTFKEILTVGAAVLFLHEDFTLVNALGLLVLIFGVVLFNMYKLNKIKEGKLRVTTIRGGDIADDDDDGLDSEGLGGVFSEQTPLVPQTMINSNTMMGGGGGGGGGGAMHPPLPPTSSSSSYVELSSLNGSGGNREGTTMISPSKMDSVFVLSSGEEDGGVDNDRLPSKINKVVGANTRHRVTTHGSSPTIDL